MSFQRERKDDENGGFSITRSSQVVSLGVPMCGNGDDVASAEMKLLVRAGDVRPSVHRDRDSTTSGFANCSEP